MPLEVEEGLAQEIEGNDGVGGDARGEVFEDGDHEPGEEVAAGPEIAGVAGLADEFLHAADLEAEEGGAAVGVGSGEGGDDLQVIPDSVIGMRVSAGRKARR